MMKLTPHEEDVLASLIACGDQRQVAHATGLSYSHIKNWVLPRIRSKLGAETTLQAAVIWATRNCDHP